MTPERTLHTCCFFGHRSINESEELRIDLYNSLVRLITVENIDTFLFGSKSQFNSLCLNLVTKIKEEYPHIKRIYVRAEFPVISDSYRSFLLESFEDTYYPQKIQGAGRAAYVERNIEMINNSHFCIVYYDEAKVPATGKSGTRIALDYAIKKAKEIILFPANATEK